eukprot:4876797-Pleurochrysis_carterae.AAC.1
MLREMRGDEDLDGAQEDESSVAQQVQMASRPQHEEGAARMGSWNREGGGEDSGEESAESEEASEELRRRRGHLSRVDEEESERRAVAMESRTSDSSESSGRPDAARRGEVGEREREAGSGGAEGVSGAAEDAAATEYSKAGVFDDGGGAESSAEELSEVGSVGGRSARDE